MTTIKESKPKILNTLDGLIANLQADPENTPAVEWQVVMIAREVVAGCSAMQLAKAITPRRVSTAALDLRCLFPLDHRTML